MIKRVWLPFQLKVTWQKRHPKNCQVCPVKHFSSCSMARRGAASRTQKVRGNWSVPKRCYSYSTISMDSFTAWHQVEWTVLFVPDLRCVQYLDFESLLQAEVSKTSKMLLVILWRHASGEGELCPTVSRCQLVSELLIMNLQVKPTSLELNSSTRTRFLSISCVVTLRNLQ